MRSNPFICKGVLSVYKSLHFLSMYNIPHVLHGCVRWRLPLIALLLVAVCACNNGRLSGIDGDGGRTDANLTDGRLPDGAVGDGSPSNDGHPHDTAPALDSGGDAEAQPDAAPDPDAALDCTTVGCGDNEYCNESTLTCECLTGFEDDGSGNCVPLNPGDPAVRSEAEMCQIWENGRQWTATTIWTPGANDCDLGTLSTNAMADGIANLNMYRLLCGLAPLTHDPDLDEDCQYCAVIQYQQGFLSHSPDPSAPCYTSQGAAAAGSSNLGIGHSSPAGAVDGFMEDNGTPSLGHRRWILHPNYGPAGLGYAGNATCLHVFSWSNTGDPEFVAWPNPGYTPLQVTPTIWSYSTSNSAYPTDQTVVTVTRISDQADLPVASYIPQGGMYMPSAIAFEPDGWSPSAGEIYEVSLSELSGGQTVVYQVKPITCP